MCQPEEVLCQMTIIQGTSLSSSLCSLSTLATAMKDTVFFSSFTLPYSFSCILVDSSYWKQPWYLIVLCLVRTKGKVQIIKCTL